MTEKLKKAKALADALDGREIKAELGIPEDDDPEIWTGLTERQRLIQRLSLRKLTQRAIANALGISPAMVNKELARIREIHERRGTGENRAAIVGEALTVYDEIERSAWEIAGTSEKDPRMKIKALELVMKARAESIKLQSSLGLLREHVIASDGDVNRMLFEKFNDTIRDLLIGRIAEAHLTSSPLEAPEPPMLDGDAGNTFGMRPLEAPEPPEDE